MHFDLLQRLPIFVSSLIADGSWPHKSSSTSKDFGTQFKALQAATDNTETSVVSKSDLIAFKAQIESLIQKSQSKAANIACKAMIAHNKLSSNKSNDTTIIPPKKKRMTHRFASDKWGPDLFYKTKEAFAEFYNATIPGMDLTAKYDYVGLTWEHCAKCKRMGNHSTANHCDSKKQGGRKRKAEEETVLPPLAAEANVAVGLDLTPTSSGEEEVFDAETLMDVSKLLDDDDSKI